MDRSDSLRAEIRHTSANSGQGEDRTVRRLEGVVEMMTNGPWQASPECAVGRDVNCKNESRFRNWSVSCRRGGVDSVLTVLEVRL